MILEEQEKRPILLDENGNHIGNYLCIWKEAGKEDGMSARMRYDGSDNDSYDNVYLHISSQAQLLFESQQVIFALMERNALLADLGKQLKKCFIDYDNRMKNK